MEPDRWEQNERLNHAALERGPDAREAFLDEACAGDEDLRREVAGLLASDNPSVRATKISLRCGKRLRLIFRFYARRSGNMVLRQSGKPRSSRRFRYSLFSS